MFDETLKAEIIEIATQHEIEPAALMAVVEVESNGQLGTQMNGKLEPMIRFEGHYFYRLLPTRKRNLALTHGLASSQAGKIKNPARQAGRWKLLKRAEVIDRDAALSSVSWGVGQVMGSHWRWLGYASIDALVLEARDGAPGQIRLMMRFIKKAGLISNLQTHDWAGFARRYNGPAYARNKYDTKMRDAYLKHKGQARGHMLANSLAMLRLGSFGEPVRELQSNLSKLGFTLRIDGDFGLATQKAVQQFQTTHQLKADGIVGPKVLEMMYRELPTVRETYLRPIGDILRELFKKHNWFNAFTNA